MKAISNRDAGARGGRAGDSAPAATACSICSGDVEVQAATLEALVKAVESGEIRPARLDDAFARLRRAKERFLAQRAARDVGRAFASLRAVIGRDEHQAIAAEMAAFL